ncbi:MAG: glycosyltransferase [Salinivirgaceae bacterium]|nr:glycosyltransferase [Salinivirgaceae bacterium]
MKLSIIIPTFNSERLIKRCLESIIGQTMGDFEVLIMDGVSSDKTLALIAELNDSRIKVFSEPDGGIYDAMNKGIEKAQGEWLYFIGSDDYLLNNNVLTEVFSQATDKFDVVYGEVESNLSEKNRGEWTLETLEYNRCHQAIFYKKSVFDEIGSYPLKHKVGADHDLNLKWFLNSHIKNRYLGLQIAHFTCGGYSSNQCDDGFFNDFYPDMIENHFKILPIHIKIKYVEKAILHTNSKYQLLKYKILLYGVRIYKKLFC